MTMKLLFICLMSALLMSCSSIGMKESPMWHMTASDEEKLEYFEEICSAYGYKYGTPEIVQCVALEKRSSSSSAGDRFRDGLQNMQNNMNNRFNDMPVTTNCRKSGNSVRCTSY